MKYSKRNFAKYVNYSFYDMNIAIDATADIFESM